jgi:hydrogenase large subunit
VEERVLGPFSRVDGDLEVRVALADGRVAEAFASTTLYRGFEQILLGRPARDALVIAPRICGCCSVAQSVAAARSLADTTGVAPVGNGALATELILACEMVADHLSHFFLCFMPDFSDPAYVGRPWHERAVRRFGKDVGAGRHQALRARLAFLHALGSLAGKWPHNLAIQPGGTTKSVDLGERMRLKAIIMELRRFLETTLFGDALEAVAALDDAKSLARWADDGATRQEADFGLFLAIAGDLDLWSMGLGPDRFLSVGGGGAAGPLFPPGLWGGGAVQPLDLALLREDLGYAWMSGPGGHPASGGTALPDRDQVRGYSWCKAPRLDGGSCEVGPFARQMVAGHPLIRSLSLDAHGRAGVAGRVVARLLELALLVPAMEGWIRALSPGQPYCQPMTVPERGRGVGLAESARGSIGHWLSVEGGRIASYQIVASGTWNVSPRDRAGHPGPLEEALAGAAVAPDDDFPLTVQHIVRSFNPCLRCAGH